MYTLIKLLYEFYIEKKRVRGSHSSSRQPILPNELTPTTVATSKSILEQLVDLVNLADCFASAVVVSIDTSLNLASFKLVFD